MTFLHFAYNAWACTWIYMNAYAFIYKYISIHVHKNKMFVYMVTSIENFF